MAHTTQAQNQARQQETRHDDDLVHHVLIASLDASQASEPPEWITVFPKLGRIETRDGRAFEIEAASLIDVFKSDGIDLPVDINHATDMTAFTGGRADAVGWVKQLREQNGELQGRIEWLEEGRALLAAKKYRYVSPSFFRDDMGRATRLRAVALVTSPALARQPALAGLVPHPSYPPAEKPMKTIATTLGLTESASETECLSALSQRLENSVPKAVHEEALSKLSSTSTELASLKAAQRKEKVDRLIEEALSAKKIVPAERDHYIALCATDDGLTNVEKLLAARVPLLDKSSLDQKPVPQDIQAMTAEQLAAKATELVQAEAKLGRTLSIADAMSRVTQL